MKQASGLSTVSLTTVALIIVVFIADVFTPLGFAVWMFYVIPLLVSGLGKSRINPFAVAIGSSILIILDLFLSPPGISKAIALENRLMGMTIFWIMAWLLVQSRHAQKLQKLTRQLEAANKELESFSYSVSHDLQAPLRAINGFSQMIMKDKEHETDAETKRRLAVIKENTEKMQNLIEGLLTLSRTGRQGVHSDTIDMNVLVKDVWKEIEREYSGNLMALTTKELHPACGDQILIRQVLANLLSNAAKYSVNRKPIEVEVGCYQESDGNVYYVKDKGVGFDMKYYDKLFGVFQRLHPASEFEGSGIGLSIAQRIIHLHGGRIWAEGKVDEGAVFFFLLPKK